jgi:hypothetical protein
MAPHFPRLTGILSLTALVLFSSCATSPPSGSAGGDRAGDLSFLPDRAGKGSLFRYYQAHGKSSWSRNWTSQFDLTGVSWNDSRTVTAISRNHVVMAGHFIRPPSVPAVFHDRDGNRHERILGPATRLGRVGDVAVAKLNRPLPDGVAHYPLATAADATHERLVLVTDKDMQLSLHRLGRVQARRVILGYDPKIDRRHWRNLVVGDSGNPAFILRNGRLALLSTHTTGGPGTGPFYGDPEVRAAVMAEISRP